MKNLFSARTAAVVLAGALAFAHPHLALASVSEDGAGDVKKQVEEAIAFPVTLQKVTGNGLVLGSPVEVSPQGDHYDVKMPGLAYVAQTGLKADIGTLVMSVTPADDGSYKTSITLPPSVTIYDATKKPLAEVSIGSQKFTGIWWPKYRTFTALDADLKDIKMTSKDEDSKFSATLGSLTSSMNLTPNSDNTWSGPAKFALSSFALTAGDKGQIKFTIDSLAGQTVYDKKNLQAMKDIEDKSTQALVDSQKDKQSVDPAQAQALLSSLVNGLQGYLDGMGSDFKATGISVGVSPLAGDKPRPDGKPQKPMHIGIESLSGAFNMKGMQENKGNISVQYSMNGLSLPDAGAGMTGMVPTATNLEIHLDNLPIQSLSTSFGGMLSGVVQSALAAQSAADPTQKSALDSQAEAQMFAAMATIPQVLATAGAKLSIVNTYANAPDFGTKLDGSFTANAKSPVMAQGSVTLLIDGLDELIVKLMSTAQAPGADPTLMGLAQGLGIAQMMGTLGKSPDGRSERTYKLEVSPEGKIMLNGADFGAAMRGLGGGAPHPGGMPAPGNGTMQSPKDQQPDGQQPEAVP